MASSLRPATVRVNPEIGVPAILIDPANHQDLACPSYRESLILQDHWPWLSSNAP